MKSSNHLTHGFTLVEMLLVVVILGILASVMAVSLSGRSEEARITRTKADLSGSLQLALDLFEQDNGRYPTAEEGLKALVENPSLPTWKGPYLKNELKPDPWDSPYIYELDTEHPGRYLLRSAGPDRAPGTEDDVTP